MLSLRLQWAQYELQALRNWLRAFISNGSALRTTQVIPSISRTFSTSQVCRETKKQWIGKPRTEWQKRQKRKQERKHFVALETLSQREELLQAVKDYDIKEVMALYASLPEKKPLSPDDFTALAQCVHQCLRLEMYKFARTQEREAKDEIVEFAVRLVKDVRRERLLPSIYAHVHLLGTFKESEMRDAGIQFWNWLQAQDEEHVNADVYAVAIDILARNGAPLEELEQLYQDALARFPGTFNAYHLSSGAILEDREREFGVKGVPMNLFLSITVARLINGDSHNAYLALDTAFRLYPAAVPIRFFASFKDERPVSEYFTLFAMACRAGIQLPLSYYKELIMRLRKSSNFRSIAHHVSVIKAMLAATQLQIGATGTVPANTVNEVTIAVTQILRFPAIATIDTKERQQIAEEVLTIVKKMLEIFARYGALPGEPLFNSIITNIGGSGHVKNMIGIATADMKALGIEPSSFTRRYILVAAGLLEDADLVQRSWQKLLETRRHEQAYPDVRDFHALVTAAWNTDLIDFAQEQFDSLKNHVDPEDRAGIEQHLANPPEEQPPTDEAQSSVLQQVSDSINGLKSIIEDLDLATKNRPVVADFRDQVLPMALIPPPEWLQLPHEEMRSVYDALTTEQKFTTPSTTSSETMSSDPATNQGPDSATPTSTTNIPFGTLRLQNWNTMNYLLWLSAKHDKDYDTAVDKALSEGVAPPRRETGIAQDELADMGLIFLGENHRAFRKESPVYHARLHQAKDEILRLRSGVPS